MRKIFLPLLLCTLFIVHAQTDLDQQTLQLEEEIASGNLSDDEMFNNYYVLMWDYFKKDGDKARFYCNQAIDFAKEKNNIEWHSKYLRRLGVMYSYWGDIDSAFYSIDNALKLIENKGYTLEECFNYEDRGNIYRNNRQYENALEAYQKADELNKKDKAKNITEKKEIAANLQKEVSILINMSGIYGMLFNFDKILEYLQQAQTIIEENPDVNFERYEYHITGFLAEVYAQLNHLEKSFTYAKQFHEMASERGDLPSMVNSLKHMSTYYRVKGDLKKSLEYATQSLEISQQTQLPSLIRISYSELTKTYLYMNDYNAALQYAELHLSITDDNMWENLEDIYADLVLIHGLLGNRKEAVTYQAKYRDILTFISDNNLHNSLQEMEVKYDVKQKELEILQHQTEINRQRTRLYIFMGSFIAVVFVVILLAYNIVLRTRRNRELADANATKDKFFSIISHDLKNPAIAQRDAIQLLLENSDKWDANTLSKFYSQLLKSANSLVDLLFTLLGWAQLQTGRMPYSPSNFDIQTIILPTIDLINNMATEKGITLNVTIPEKSIVFCDRNMLTTVIRNLLTNAIKYTNKEGIVALEISILSSKETATPKYNFSISDTGIGINEEQIKNIFSLERTQSQKGTSGEIGSGLGLIVCRDLLQIQKSKLNIESEVGKGSRFWFEI